MVYEVWYQEDGIDACMSFPVSHFLVGTFEDSIPGSLALLERESGSLGIGSVVFAPGRWTRFAIVPDED